MVTGMAKCVPDGSTSYTVPTAPDGHAVAVRTAKTSDPWMAPAGICMLRLPSLEVTVPPCGPISTALAPPMAGWQRFVTQAKPGAQSPLPRHSHEQYPCTQARG